MVKVLVYFGQTTDKWPQYKKKQFQANVGKMELFFPLVACQRGFFFKQVLKSRWLVLFGLLSLDFLKPFAVSDFLSIPPRYIFLKRADVVSNLHPAPSPNAEPSLCFAH